MEYLTFSQRKCGQLRQFVLSVLDYMWVLWKKSDESARIEAIESESLYRWRVKDYNIETLSKENADELLENPYSSFESFFSDFSSSCGDSNSQPTAYKLTKKVFSLQAADVQNVCALHMLLHSREMLPQANSFEISFLHLYEVSSRLHLSSGVIPGT